ncbi:hypothetical protein ABFX02_09G098400 [Erythranthe guttata]
MNKKMINVTIMVLMMLLTSELASAGFKECFEICVVGCVVGHESEPKCAIKCLAKCIVNPPGTMKDYCKLGCAADQCVKFGKDADKMDSCVTSCETGQCSQVRRPRKLA